MPFVGRTDATIDSKLRLALPAKFRARWSPKADGPTWYCVPSEIDRELRLYPERTFEKLYEQVSRDATLMPSSSQAAIDFSFYTDTEQMDVDANHRVRLQAWQLEMIGLGRDVIVGGSGDYLVVINRADYPERSRRGREARAQLDERPHPAPGGSAEGHTPV